MKRKVTSRDVAREAGVSRATVSYILNNAQDVRISDETRQRVLEAAKKLGYHLDLNAQALKTNRSMSIGVVSRRNIAESRFTNVLAGIKDVLSKEKYSILICSDEMDEFGYPEYYRLYRQKKIDGIIFISYQEQLIIEKADKRAEHMLEEQIPCVFADYHLKNPMVNCVDINYFHGGYTAARYLIERGHKKIAFLVPDLDTEQERQRTEGVSKAVEEVDGIELCIYNVGKSGREISDNIVKALNDRDKYTAIIAAWGSMGAKTLYHTCRMKIDVPGEVSVISLAGDNAARFTYPKLSTCELPLYELGARSARILIDNINKYGMPVSIMLPCSLNIQDSCR